jgi:HrpA-like RNA helicase
MFIKISLHTDFQIPQFLLDDWLINWNSANRRHVEIICTQPRRLSAIGVAERVAEERGEEIGDTVGHQVVHLLFCNTTAVNLNSLECSL